MKQILTTLLILTWMVGAGQSVMDAMKADTTASLVKLAANRLMDSTYVKPIKYDTVPVMLMVCDTSRFSVLRAVKDTVLSDAGMAFIVVGRKGVYTQDDRIYWINGYQVREAYSYWGGPDTEPGQMMVHAVAVRRTDYKHIKYLDNKKQPLKHEIVVWDSRRRSK